MSVLKGGVRMNVEEAESVRLTLQLLLEKFASIKKGTVYDPNLVMQEQHKAGEFSDLPTKEGLGGGVQIPASRKDLYIKV